MISSKNESSIVSIIHIVLAALFIVNGVLGIQAYNSNSSGLLGVANSMLGNNVVLLLIFGILDFVAGLFVFYPLVAKNKMAAFLLFLVFIYLLVKLVLFRIIGDIDTGGNNVKFSGGFVFWLKNLLSDLVAILAVLVIGAKEGKRK